MKYNTRYECGLNSKSMRQGSGILYSTCVPGHYPYSGAGMPVLGLSYCQVIIATVNSSKMYLKVVIIIIIIMISKQVCMRKPQQETL